MKKKLSVPCILLFFLTAFIPLQLYAQRFILLNNNKTIYQNITRGDSAFFKNNFKESIKYYKELMTGGYEENMYLNQVQNYLGDQDPDHAVQIIGLMADKGFYKSWTLEKDSAYINLKQSPAYLPVLKKVKANFNAYILKNNITKPLIAEQLMWMSYLDQYYQWINSFKRRYEQAYPNLSKNQVDTLTRQTMAENTKSLKQLFSSHGYLWHNAIGEIATHQIWLMVQHADRDIPFQEKYLKELKLAAKNKQASLLDLAYLTDRLAKNKGKKQLYGTQMNYKTIEDPVKGKIPLMELWPVENPEKLDERRKEVGLIPINEYLEMMKQLNGWK
jgi:hypothetical protein